MSGLFFRKDTEFDTKIRPQEDTKYDTYRLWGKAEDTSDVAFDIYVKIPKEESIGNLVPKLANLASSQIKEIKEKREPMLFYFDDLANSSLTIDPNIDLKIDPSLELHVKKVKLEDVKDFSFSNASGAKREVYIDGLYLEDIVGSSIAFNKDGYKESNKDTKIAYNNAQGLHIEASDMDSLDFAGVVCYDVNTDCTPESNRKIVLDSRTVKRTSFTITSTDINFESKMGGNTQVYIANTGGSITINGIGEYHQFFKNCKFIVEENKNQEIAYDTGKVEVGKIENSGIFENTFFEGRVELSATNTRRIKSSIFKNTNTVLNSLEGFDRCEFNGDNNISSISEKVNNGLFQNARCKNVTGLSFNCIKDFVGADGSYQELSGQTDEKLKITEKLDIL